jgi:hypothetical protein
MKNHPIILLTILLKLSIIGSYISSTLKMKKPKTFDYRGELRRTHINKQTNKQTKQPTNKPTNEQTNKQTNQ